MNFCQARSLTVASTSFLFLIIVVTFSLEKGNISVKTVTKKVSVLDLPTPTRSSQKTFS